MKLVSHKEWFENNDYLESAINKIEKDQRGDFCEGILISLTSWIPFEAWKRFIDTEVKRFK
jgi:hypothetical protein